MCSNKSSLSEDWQKRYRPVSVLPLDVVQRIASGEVISDYTSVVQELVENSLDAGSTDIRIDVDFSARTVTVSDDGGGIESIDDLLSVAKCNATSKLSSLDELNAGVRTLGFRGQGLWAIASSSESLSVSSRPAHRTHGYNMRFDGNGHPSDNPPIPIPMPKGTIVSAKGLPWDLSVPYRTKAFRKCKLFLFRMALAHPHVLLRLSRAGRPLWSSGHCETSAGGSPEWSNATAILARHIGVPTSLFRNGLYNIPSAGSVAVTIGLPSMVSVSSAETLIVTVNGRPVKNDVIGKVVIAACASPRGRFPVAYIGFNISPSHVNWNVCPSKSRIRFRDDELSTKLSDAVKDALSCLTRISLNSRDAVDGETKIPDVLPRQTVPVPDLLISLERKALQSRRSMLLSNDDDGTKIGDVKWNQSSQTKELGIFGARIVAQVLNTYILVEHDGGIMLIEQHVADERFIFEHLCESWRKKAFIALKDPVRLSSEFPDESLFRLTTLGLDVELSEDVTTMESTSEYLIKRVPEVLGNLAYEDLLRIIIQLGKDDVTIEEAAANISCRLAVRNGRVLDERKMKMIVKNLFSCSNAFTCPHGRPIFHEVGTKELAGLFKRSWMPEKPGIVHESAKRRTSEGRDVIHGVLEGR